MNKGITMAKKVNNAELVAYIEELIKKYNKKPEKKIKKKDIVELLQDAVLIVPARVDLNECENFEEMIEGAILSPDIVKDGGRTRLLPVFTTYEQIPRDYMDEFSLIRMPASAAFSYMNECEELSGMVLNPFTEYNLELRKKKNAGVTKTDIRQYQESVVSASETEPSAMIIYNNKKYVIDKTPFTIGRENTNIVIPETYISKIHVVISYKDGKYRIADYDSTNGTKINGTELRPKVYYELRDGYEIELAEKEIMVAYIN